MCPAYNDNMTKSTKEIPSGKQIENILEVVLAAWTNEEKMQIRKRNQKVQKNKNSLI